MIPRVFHQYWSERPYPPLYGRYSASWLEMNQGWDMAFWTAERLTGLRLRARFDDAHLYSDPRWIGNWKSHIVRYEMLHRYGGVWIDSDMECLRPIDELLDGVTAFVARDTPTQVQTAIMGSVPGGTFMEDLIGDTARMSPLPTRVCASVTQVQRVLPRHPEVSVFAPWTFYPLDRDGRGELGAAYGVHRPRAY